jgi:hypothetical protein
MPYGENLDGLFLGQGPIVEVIQNATQEDPANTRMARVRNRLADGWQILYQREGL